MPHVKMVTRHYGHLSRDYITDAIRKAAPVFGVEPDTTVVPIGAGNRLILARRG